MQQPGLRESPYSEPLLLYVLDGPQQIFSFFLVAVLALVVMSEGTEAVTIPAWCNCSNDQAKSKKACSVAGANYDGSSCGLDHIGKYNAFLMSCSQQNGSYKCWH